MSKKILAVLTLAVAVAVAGFFVIQGKRQAVTEKPTPKMAPFTAPLAATLRGMSRDHFFDVIAAYCKQHPDPSDLGSCVACSQETCPTCGFGPERSALVAICNPNSWDCAASAVFPPGDGAACALTPYGPCACPVQKSTNVRETIFAALGRPPARVSTTPQRSD